MMGRAARRKREVPRAERIKGRATTPVTTSAQVEVYSAHHEAAHAVVAHALGVPQGGIALDATAGADGLYTSISLGPHPAWLDQWIAAPREVDLDDARRAYVQSVVQATFAGPVSDARFAGSGFDPDNITPPRSDGRIASSLVWRLVGGEDEGRVLDATKSIWQDTAALVERHWPLIEVVAVEAIKRRSLTSAEVAALVDNYGDSR